MSLHAEYEKVEALLPDFQYVDRDHERIIVTVGFVASFYFWGGHLTAKRDALADCFDAYEAVYGDKLSWACDPESWKTVKLAKMRLPTFRDYIKTLDEDDGVGWYVSSGDDRDAVGEYVAHCMTERGWENGELSCFEFHLPREDVFHSEKRKVLESLWLTCIEKLAPFHANAGLAAVTIEQSITWEPEILDLATRYLAVQVADVVHDGAAAPNGIKGVNWLNYVGDLLTERVGGPQAFIGYCQRFGVHLERSSNGFIIRAGATPQLGPITEPPPPAYGRVNEALRPLRNGRHSSLGTGSIDGELRFNRCTTDLWIRRFDAPGIWPPPTFAGLSPGPVGAKPAKKIKLETGKACTVHGRYRKLPLDPALFDEDEEFDRTPMVVLLPGDMAPFHLTLGPHGEFVSREAVTWELAAELPPVRAV